MYDELVKRLRIAAQWADQGLVIPPSICLEAADTIEELNKKANGLEWISVEDDLPKDTKPVLAYYGFQESEETGMYYQGILSYYPTDAHPHWQHESTGVIVRAWKPLDKDPLKSADDSNIKEAQPENEYRCENLDHACRSLSDCSRCHMDR